MHYVGVDLHKRTMFVAVDDSEGPVGEVCSYACQDVTEIKEHMERLWLFRAVIETSSSYRIPSATITPR